jgi:amino acid adenylation domain-containing protein
MNSGCVHALFESRADKHPERTALIFGKETLTYGQLNLRANALAHSLVRAGCRPDALIGLHASRGFDLVIGILGILKAGGAYVPLDPGYPEARLHHVIEDAGISLIVSDRGLACRPSDFRSKAIEVDTGALEPAGPVCGVNGGNSAYAIYTSGSTGTPKGVVLNHLGLRKLIEFAGQQMEIGPGDRILQFAAFTFDASIWEIFAALCHGATLVLARCDDLVPRPAPSGADSHARRNDSSSPTACAPSPVSGRFGHYAHRDNRRGEMHAASGPTMGRRRRRFFNAYGPSEATIYATISEVDPEGEGDPSIGSPVPGAACVVVDQSGRKASVGEVGELLIGGIGVGRGYINRPELTAEKFVTLSMNGDTDRYFRTGDLVRVRADGAFDYIGRIDRQIKVRGYRIEPGEIESCLDSHPAIASSVVVARSDPAGGRSLIAFYLAAAGRPAPAAGELSAHLSQMLPEYMVPCNSMACAKRPISLGRRPSNPQIERKHHEA